MSTLSAYQQLELTFARIADLGHAKEILGWDRDVMMPEGGAEGRASALATLEVLAHEQLTHPRVADLLNEAEQSPPADPWQAANLREIRRNHRHATAVPTDLVEASSLASSACHTVWETARPASDFAAILPSFTEVVRLTREIAAAKAAAFGCSPYEALLDEYDDTPLAAIDKHFADLAVFLPGFTAEVIEAQKRRSAPLPLSGFYPLAQQEKLGRQMKEILGFDGRMDTSTHPFCGGAPGDVRITTRYDEQDPVSSLMGVLHETGHALYEQGLPKNWMRQPVGWARGMAMHESQSLLIEMQVACGKDFLSFAVPLMRAAFNGSGPEWETGNLVQRLTNVQPSFIRVDADEVTYPAHVIMRFRLEQAMIAGNLAVKDLPGAWAESSQALLGITPPNDRLGCLQDTHWYGGSIGYFPTYTLGAMNAAQLMVAARAAVPEIPAALQRGDLTPLMGWLRANVHGKGSLVSTEQLMIDATGAPTGTEAYKQHLRARYLEDAAPVAKPVPVAALRP